MYSSNVSLGSCDRELNRYSFIDHIGVALGVGIKHGDDSF